MNNPSSTENNELSIDELENVAGGGFFRNLGRAFRKTHNEGFIPFMKGEKKLVVGLDSKALPFAEMENT